MLASGCGGTKSAATSAASHQAGPTRPALKLRSGAPTSFTRLGMPLPDAVSANTSLGGEQNGSPPVAPVGYTMFVATGTSLQAINLGTGKTTGTARPADTVPNPPANGDSGLSGGAAAPPVVAKVGAQQVALVGYVVQVPGKGTVPPSTAVELDAVNAGGHRLWQILAPLPGQPSDLSGQPTVTLTNVDGNYVAAAVGDGDDNYRTVGFDLRNRKAIWQNASFVASAAAGNTAVGTLDTSGQRSGLGSHSESDTLNVAGLSLRSGKTQWTKSEGGFLGEHSAGRAQHGAGRGRR